MRKLVITTILLLAVGCTGKSTNDNLRGLSSTPDEDPWTVWSRSHGKVGGLLVLSKIRKNLMKQNLHDPHASFSYIDSKCEDKHELYRSANGICNDMSEPAAGAALTAFGRNIPPELIGNETREQMMKPSPRLVAQELFRREGSPTDYKKVPFLNMLAASWIQFMNHDWVSHGANEKGNPHKFKAKGKPDLTVQRTKVDHTDRTHYKKKFTQTSINQVTHWWDASQLYGSDIEVQKKLRVSNLSKVDVSQKKINLAKVNFGKMKLENGLLPKRKDLDVKRNRANQGYEMTGFTDNWWVGLSMLHNLFVKEHNHIATMLTEKYVSWSKKKGMWQWDDRKLTRKVGDVFVKGNHKKYFDTKGLDEHLFQVSRLINAAVLAKIHTIEWTPAILANDTLKKAMFVNWYGAANPQTWSKVLKYIPGFNKTDWTPFRSGFLAGGIVGDNVKNYGVPYSLTEEFTSVYRLHSLIPEELVLKKLKVTRNSKGKKPTVSPISSKNVPVKEVRNEKSYALTQDYKMNELFYSFGTQKPGQLTLNNFPRFLQDLDIPTVGKMDLGAVDIFRDRERGVPRYNQLRRGISLKPISSFRDFFPADKELDERQKKVLAKFRKVYGFNADGSDNVEAIDLLVGSLAEEVRPEGFGFGETLFQIFIVNASRRLMADRFFTNSYNKETYTKAGLKYIDHEGYMHKVIQRHMPALKSKMKGLETAFAPWKE